MMNEIIKDMARHGILPIAIFENTLHVYYKDAWYAIVDDQYYELCPLNDDTDELIEEFNRFSEEMFND